MFVDKTRRIVDFFMDDKVEILLGRVAGNIRIGDLLLVGHFEFCCIVDCLS